jgi:hypothetical protein
VFDGIYNGCRGFQGAIRTAVGEAVFDTPSRKEIKFFGCFGRLEDSVV